MFTVAPAIASAEEPPASPPINVPSVAVAPNAPVIPGGGTTAGGDNLDPVLPGGSGGGMITPFATPAGDTFVCTKKWTTIQATPSGFVVGNCGNGWHLRRQSKSDPYDGHYWEGGHIFGDYQGCGWVHDHSSQLASGTTASLCPYGVSMTTTQYMSGDNNGPASVPYCSWKPDSSGNYRCTDGTPTQVIATCPIYANYRPWLAGQTPVNPVVTMYPGEWVAWRYVAKFNYPSHLPTGMVMVRTDPAKIGDDGVPMGTVINGRGNWGFIHMSCLNGLPGHRAL